MATKRGNSYRVQKMFNGKRYSISFDHNPTNREVIKAFANVAETTHYGSKTFKKAAAEYVESKKNVLSPSTVREYKRKIENFSKEFNNLQVKDITQQDVQKEINRMAKDKAPRTVRDNHALISSVLKVYRPDFKLNTTLPQKVKVEKYIPIENEIKQLIDYSKTASKGIYYVPLVLGALGLRRSEIIALEPSDINDGIATINKAMVKDENKKWVIKTTKTTESTRQIPIPKEIEDIIKERGYVFNGYPNAISNFIARACKELNIEHFSLHKMRHYFATKLSSENVDIETIKYLGGWSSDYVLTTVYRHKVDDKIKKASQLITDGFL